MPSWTQFLLYLGANVGDATRVFTAGQGVITATLSAPLPDNVHPWRVSMNPFLDAIEDTLEDWPRETFGAAPDMTPEQESAAIDDLYAKCCECCEHEHKGAPGTFAAPSKMSFLQIIALLKALWEMFGPKK